MLPGVKQIRILFFLLPLTFIGFYASLQAETAEEPESLSSMEYMKAFDHKFESGATNFVVGWTEVVRQPLRQLHKEDKKNKILKFSEGFAQGAVFAVVDMAGGFLNALTSPLPQFKIPLPQQGVQKTELTGGI